MGPQIPYPATNSVGLEIWDSVLVGFLLLLEVQEDSQLTKRKRIKLKISKTVIQR